MKQFLTTIGQFFKGAGGKFSARRLCGITGFTSCIVAMFIPNVNPEEYRELLFASVGLLGLSSVDKFTKPKTQTSNV